MSRRTYTLTETPRFTARYEAAEPSSTLRDWGASGSRMPHEDSAYTGSVRSLTTSRLRWEVRNNAYLAGLYAKYPEAVGTPSLRIRTSDARYNRAVEGRFYKWTKSCTSEGDSLDTAVRAAIAELLVTGEVFIVLLADGKIQLVPSEYCGSPQGVKPRAGCTETNGIGYAKSTGRPAYYRFSSGSSSGVLDYADSVTVEADYVIHLWMRDRVAMGRGLPWLLSSLPTARDLAEITRAKTKQIKDVSSVSGVIEKQDGSSIPGNLAQLNGLGGQVQPEASQVQAKPFPIELSPGTLVFLDPGEKANFLTSKYEASDYKELILLMLHAISSPVGLPVELWFSGLGDVNYSGFKGLGTQWDARRRHVITFLEDRLLDRLAVWWTQKSRKLGIIPSNPDGDDSLMEWAWRVTAVLDEEKAAKAAQIRIQTGLSSHADEWERGGKFADEVVASRVELWHQTRAAAGLPKAPCPLEFILKGEVPALSGPSGAPAQAPSP